MVESCGWRKFHHHQLKNKQKIGVSSGKQRSHQLINDDGREEKGKDVEWGKKQRQLSLVALQKKKMIIKVQLSKSKI